MIDVAFRKYSIGRWSIDCTRMTISSEQETVQLSAKVFELLKLFILSDDHIVSKDDAIDKIWLGNVGVGKTGFPNAVWHLRKVFTDLGAENDEVFVTIQKVGYQLVLKPEGIKEEVDIPWVSKKISPLKLSAIIISLLIAIIIYIPYMSSPPTALQPKVIKHITNFEGVEKQPAISPDGQFLALHWRQSSRKGQIYLINLLNENAPIRKLTESNFDEYAPVWSPDGKSIAYARLNGEGICEIRTFQLISREDKLIDSGCYFNNDDKVIDWSSSGKLLAYNKVVGDSTAIFTYEFSSENIKQITTPEANYEDLSVSFIYNDKKLAVIRKHAVSSELLTIADYQSDKPVVELIKTNDLALLGFVWDKLNEKLILTQAMGGNYAIVALDLNDKSEVILDKTPTPGSLTINPKTDELVFTRYSTSEYIEEVSMETGRTTRRIASSSRDLYGSHVAFDDSILFSSNRSGSWELWLRQKFISKQITKDIGSVLIATVSPSGNKFVVIMKTEEYPEGRFYLGTLPNVTFKPIANIDVQIQNPNWSLDEDRFYFSGSENGKWGLYEYNLTANEMKQLTDSGEVFAVEGANNVIYTSRFNQRGIWAFNKTTQQFTKVEDNLLINDYGNYFWVDNNFYYLYRDDTNDQVKRLNIDGEDEVVYELPVNSIRSYSALSPTIDSKVLVSRHAINDADLYSFSLK
ncbi:winged helix-turn-helix domain-containing protein [Thalassomonas sp. M1454]|uniref:winged helix-turn-helix domain-containing protein n=1 Tax=Thalassomonas sp. M1454 TaxID=2594477 RepID=UPI00117C93F1|nr:winged helix-turn-helix domain-containing protein [Thalassomonas sp. M1454]TRX57451.1 hypothetical protein FNN08_08125 [Thalassomonas sp. M1454]